MIDVHELLQMKEDDIVRVRKEIDALRLVASMLADSDETFVSQSEMNSSKSSLAIDTNVNEDHSQDQSHEAETVSASPKRSLLGWLNRAAGE